MSTTYPVHVKGDVTDEYVKSVIESARNKVGLMPEEIIKVIFVVDKVINFVVKTK